MLLPLVSTKHLLFFQDTIGDETFSTMCADFFFKYCTSVRGEYSCGASVALCSPTACHTSHREILYPNAHAHALSSWARPYLPPPRHAHPSVLAQLLQASEGLATVLTAVYRHLVAVLGLMFIHVARGGSGLDTQWAAEGGSRSREKGRCRLSGPRLMVASCQDVDKCSA